MSRFVRPDVAILKISGGDTLTVKKRLNAGEERELFARMYTAGLDGQLRVNPFSHGLALVLAYLVDWSIVDDDGKLVPIAGLSQDQLASVLNALDPASWAEIRAAVEVHDEVVRAEREQEKNDRDGGKASPVISPSPSAVTGAMSGCVN